MSGKNNEASTAGEKVDLSLDENPNKAKKQNCSGVSQSRNSNLPSSAGSSSNKNGAGARDQGFNRPARGHQKNFRGQKGSRSFGNKGKGEHGFNQEAEVQNYRLTTIYAAAMDKGFKNDAARLRFNEWVAANRDAINETAQTACLECGVVDLFACEHRLAPQSNHIDADDDEAVVFNVGPNREVVASYVYEQRYWQELRDKMMNIWNKPRFDPSTTYNPDLHGFDNSLISQADCFNEELFNYIRLHRNVDYLVDGVFNRRVAMQHASVLAIKFMDEKKIPLDSRTETLVVNTFWHTVQRAVDDQVQPMISAQRDEHRNWLSKFSLLRPFQLAGSLSIPQARVIFFIAIFLGCLSPTLRREALSVPMKINAFMFEKAYRTNWDILQLGSEHALHSTVNVLSYTVNAIKDLTWNGGWELGGLSMNILSSCKDATTTSWSLLKNGISKRLPTSWTVPTTTLSEATAGTVNYVNSLWEYINPPAEPKSYYQSIVDWYSPPEKKWYQKRPTLPNIGQYLPDSQEWKQWVSSTIGAGANSLQGMKTSSKLAATSAMHRVSDHAESAVKMTREKLTGEVPQSWYRKLNSWVGRQEEQVEVRTNFILTAWRMICILITQIYGLVKLIIYSILCLLRTIIILRFWIMIIYLIVRIVQLYRQRRVVTICVLIVAILVMIISPENTLVLLILDSCFRWVNAMLTQRRMRLANWRRRLLLLSLRIAIVLIAIN